MKEFTYCITYLLIITSVVSNSNLFAQYYDFTRLKQNITASDRDTGAFFGSSFVNNGTFNISNSDHRDKAIDASGQTVLASALFEDFDASGNNELLTAGAAYFYEKNPIGFYNEVVKVVASDRAPEDYFGYSVAIDGDYAIIGATGEDEDENGANTLSNSGSVYIFKKINNSWQEIQKIVASDRASNNEFGKSVTISGNYLAVGVPTESEDATGGNSVTNAGAVYIFERTGGTWQEVQKIVSNTRNVDDFFGTSVSMCGEDLVVGVIGMDLNAMSPEAGGAIIFKRINGTWMQDQVIHDDTTAIGSYQPWGRLGRSVSIDKNLIVMSGHHALGYGNTILYKRTGGIWDQTDRLRSSVHEEYPGAVKVKDNLVALCLHWQPNNGLESLNIFKIDTATGLSIATNTFWRSSYNDNPDVPIMLPHSPVPWGQGPFFSFSSSVAITNNEVISGGAAEVDANGFNPMETAGGLHVFEVGPSIIIDSLSLLGCNNDGYVAAHSESANTPISYSWNTVPPILDSTATFTSGGTYNLTMVDANNDTSVLHIYMPEISSNTTSADLAVYPSTGGGFFPGATGRTLSILGKNKTCFSANGSLDVILDPQTNYTSASIAPDQIIGDTLRWNFSNLTSDSSGVLVHVYFDIQTTASINDTLCFNSIISPISGDVYATDNTEHLCIPVVASYDPNDKQVFPQRCQEGYILNTEKLTYRIRFQNTGTDTARNVVIVDTLDANLNETSFNLLSQSHDGYVEIVDGHILKFNFPQIMLPDSHVNEPASNGYILFEIEQQPGLSDGTIIENNAAIYFDFNEPVITNSTYNQVVSTIPVCNIATNSMDRKSKETVHIYPNPGNGQFFFTYLKTGSIIQVYDITGKLIMNTTSVEDQKTINLSDEENGIYFYQVKTKSNTYRGKLIKQ